MAVKLNYVLTEAASNFRRNFFMATAAILTAAVSLSLVGGALLLRQAVDRATVQWKDGAELHIYMNQDATQDQVNAVKNKLENSLDVKRFRYLDQNAAYEEAKQLFANEKDTLDNLTPQLMPPSFRVVPKSTELIQGIGERFENDPGVKAVRHAEKQIKRMVNIIQGIQIGVIVIAAVLLISATLLILNAIRIAIFARRREVAVMKLVGATNWFIRVPFMLEGMIQGLLGGLLAVVAVFLMRLYMVDSFASGDDSPMRLYVSVAETMQTSIFIVLVGMVVGVLGSIAAVHRFLDT